MDPDFDLSEKMQFIIMQTEIVVKKFKEDGNIIHLIRSIIDVKKSLETLIETPEILHLALGSMDENDRKKTKEICNNLQLFDQIWK